MLTYSMKIKAGSVIQYQGKLYCCVAGNVYVYQEFDSSWYLVRQMPEGLELQRKKCECELQLLMCRGCQCGGG